MEDSQFPVGITTWIGDEEYGLPGIDYAYPLLYRIWDNDEQIEYPAAPTIHGNNDTIGGIATIASLYAYTQPPHWGFFEAPAWESHSTMYPIRVSTATLNNLPLEIGDEIGVFDGDSGI